MTVTITGLTARPGKPNKRGDTIVGFFDCLARGFLLRGCALVLTARGGFTVCPPKLNETGERIAVQINEDALRHEITTAAKAAFSALALLAVEPAGNSELETAGD
jgi:hypothetical protein